jgi:hypothetical protein
MSMIALQIPWNLAIAERMTPPHDNYSECGVRTTHLSRGFGCSHLDGRTRSLGGERSPKPAGTPLHITLDELHIECCFPTDDATARLCRQLATDTLHVP